MGIHSLVANEHDKKLDQVLGGQEFKPCAMPLHHTIYRRVSARIMQLIKLPCVTLQYIRGQQPFWNNVPISGVPGIACVNSEIIHSDGGGGWQSTPHTFFTWKFLLTYWEKRGQGRKDKKGKWRGKKENLKGKMWKIENGRIKGTHEIEQISFCFLVTFWNH